MKPYPFDCRVVDTIDEAVSLLAEEGTDAKIIAGGQSLGPMLNYHLVRPDFLIDVNRVAELNFISEEVGVLRIGAATTETAIETSPLVSRLSPLLVEATTHIGFPSIRHRGTIGGSVAHNDPAAEYPATLLALDATFDVASVSGRRTLTASELFADRFLETTLAADEMIVAINIPAASTSSRFGFSEFEERAGDFATAGVAVLVDVDDETIRAASVAAFGGLYPSRFAAAEEALVGQVPTADTLGAAAAAVAGEFPAGSDVHGSAAYRSRLVEALTRRALTQATAVQATS